MADTRSVTNTLRIAASPEEVFRALTDAKELTNWFPTEARSEPREGGEVHMSWGENWVSGAGTFTEFDPPHKLCIRHEEAFGSLPTQQEWTITRDGQETVLHLVHSGFGVGARFDDEYDSVRTGWQFELSGLKHYLENHKGTKRDVVVRQVPVSVSPAEAHAALLGEAPAPGEAFGLKIPGYGMLQGEARVNNAPRDFAAAIPGINNAYFRCAVEACGGPVMAILWLSCYGVEQKTRDAIGDGFHNLLSTRLAAAVKA